MKLLITFTLALLIAVAGVAWSQVKSADTHIYDLKKIRIPYKDPPPSIIYYVPDEFVLELTPETRISAVRSDEGFTATGITAIDELNRKFGVTKCERQFPDMPNVREEARLSEAQQTTDMSRYYALKFNRKYQLEEVLKAYAQSDAVVHTEPIAVHPTYEVFPNDTYFLTDQWNYYDDADHDIDATNAWEFETGDAQVILGDLDTGLQYNMLDLGGPAPHTNGNVWINDAEYNGTPGVDDDGNGYVDDWVGWDFVTGVGSAWPGEDASVPDNEPTDFNGHGSHVGGIMGAITNNNRGVAGLAGGWNTGPSDPANGVKVMACRIGWSAPHPIYGYEVGYVRMDFAASAIYYAVNNGADAINCSWGSSYTGNLAAALDYARDNEVVVVAAAGNANSQSADYLGTRPEVIDVCATDSNDLKADFSNYGTWVDLAAPGTDILSTYSFHYTHYYAYVSGTSQAAPHVTGAAGLLRSHKPDLTRQEIFDILVNTTDYIDDLNPGYAGRLGSGRLNVKRAIDAVYAPDVTVTYPNGGEVFYIGQIATITWDASDNVGIVNTIVEHSVDGGQSWVQIADLPGNPGSFDWTVTGPPSSTCRTQVTCYDAEGGVGSDMSDEDFCPPYKRHVNSGIPTDNFAIAGPDGIPGAFVLHPSQPNPFNPSTEIRFNLPNASDVKLEIFNILGQRVATLVDEFREAGEHTVVWNGTDDQGRPVASGMYLSRLKMQNEMATRKMMLLK